MLLIAFVGNVYKRLQKPFTPGQLVNWIENSVRCWPNSRRVDAILSGQLSLIGFTHKPPVSTLYYAVLTVWNLLLIENNKNLQLVFSYKWPSN